MSRQLRALALSPFIRQRLTMFICQENYADLQMLSELIEAGRVVPTLDRTYPWPRHPTPCAAAKPAKPAERDRAAPDSARCA